MKSVFNFLVLVFGIYQWGISQNIGHFNSVTITADLPEIKAADEKLSGLNDSLVTALETERQKLVEKYNQEQEKYQQGLMSPQQIQQVTAELQAKQEELNKQESQFQFILIQRRQQLYAPIFDEIDGIVSEIAQSGSYSIIIDSSKPGLVYLNPEDDISEMILTQYKSKRAN